MLPLPIKHRCKLIKFINWDVAGYYKAESLSLEGHNQIREDGSKAKIQPKLRNTWCRKNAIELLSENASSFHDTDGLTYLSGVIKEQK